MAANGSARDGDMKLSSRVIERVANRLLRRTTPGVRRATSQALGQHKRGLGVLAITTVVLGVMPTAKSAFESTIINQVNRELQEGRSSDDVWRALSDAFSAPTHSTLSSEGGVEGVIIRIAGAVSDQAPLGMVLLLYVVVVVIAYFAAVAGAKRRAAVTRTVMVELRREGIDRALDPRNPTTTLPSNASMDLETDADPGGRQSVEIHTGSGNLAGGVGNLLGGLQAAFAVVTALVAVAFGSWQLALLLLVFVVGQLLVGYLEQRRLEDRRQDLDRKRNRLVAKSNDIIRKRDLILAHDAGEQYADHLRVRADAYAAIDEELSWRQQRYRFAAGLISDFGRMGVLLGAVVLVLLSDPGVSNVGDAYFIIAIYYRLLNPTQQLVGSWANFRRARQESHSFEQMLEDDPGSDVSAAPEIDDPPAADTAIALRHVAFSYPTPDGDESVLTDCSFEIKTGATTLVLGRSGSGKTTLARMILGFLEPSAGQVWVAGRRVTRDTDLEQLHRELSYLAQEEHVIDDTVRANLFPDGDQDEDARLLDVMRRVGLPNSSGRTDGMGLLGAEAATLSGGEKQRLALARVLVDDDPIVIMDEPLAGVDAFTFEAISPEIRALIAQRTRTILIISHRLAFAGYADHIVILEDGRVIESGSREALMEPGRTFRRLHEAAISELTGRPEGA